MKILNLAVILSEDEARLAADIFSGKSKTLVLPYYFPFADAQEFLLVALGAKPGVAVVKVSGISYASPYNLLHYFTTDDLAEYSAVLKKESEENSDQLRLFTIIQIKSVTMIPMDFHEIQLARYLSGDLKEDGDTEHKHSDILGKLTGP